MILLAWLVVRLPLVVFGLAPMVQVDSLYFRTFATGLRDPHNPFFYGEFLKILGPYHSIAAQHLFVLVSAWVLYAVGRDALSRRAGLFAGLFVAVYGGYVLYAHSYMSEILFCFVLALHFGALWLAVSRESAPWFFVAGLLVGVAVNVRAVAQYQVIVLALALAPFYLRGGRPRAWLKATGALAAGFLLLYLPVAGAVRAHTGNFGITNGFPRAAMYRLVWDESAPVSAVEVDDPLAREVRDYLAGLGYRSDRIWNGAYGHIRKEILGKPDPVNNREVDRLVTDLWLEYVKTYPFRYTMYSMGELLSVMTGEMDLSYMHDFSRSTLATGPDSRLAVWAEHVPPSERVLGSLHFLYTVLACLPGCFPVVLVVLSGGAILLRRASPRARVLLVLVLATMLYLLVPQHFASIAIVRYKLPFFMGYALVFGLVCARLPERITKSRGGNREQGAEAVVSGALPDAHRAVTGKDLGVCAE
ncbi:MAG: ArnT family glycosyltransferase [Desulfatibacillaceae bacterium]